MIEFEERRQTDPQGVIDDLIEQTTAQAKTINDLRKVLTEVDAKIVKALKI